MAIKKTRIEVRKKVKRENNSSMPIINDRLIKEYADIFSNHSLKLLEVSVHGTKITLKKSDDSNIQNIVRPISSIPMQTLFEVQDEVVFEKEEISSNKSSNSNYLEIVSPIIGIFYESSSPDTAPYVKEGDIVTVDTVVCIVEAMKMMNEIKAGINGKIVKKIVDNNSAIEVGAVLFLIEP